jgi:hypothetical protein
MKNKIENQINLDQLKTLILIKGEERKDEGSLPSLSSLTFLFPICFSPIFPIEPPNLPTLVVRVPLLPGSQQRMRIRYR